MALQPFLAALIVASLGLTAYVSSVSREVRTIVQEEYSFAQLPPPPSGGGTPPPPSGGSLPPPPSGGSQPPPPSGGSGGGFGAQQPPPPGGTPGMQPGGTSGAFGPPPGGQQGGQMGQGGQQGGQQGLGGFPGQGSTGGLFPGKGLGVGGTPGKEGQAGQFPGGQGGQQGGQMGQGGQQGMQGKGMMGGQQGGQQQGMMGEGGKGSGQFPSFGAPPGGTPGMQPGGEGGKFPSFGPPPGGGKIGQQGGMSGGFGGGFGGLGGPPGGGQIGQQGGMGREGQGQPGMMQGGEGQEQRQSRFEFKGFEPPQGQEGELGQQDEERFEKERARQEERTFKDMQRGISQMERRGPHKEAGRVLAQIKRKFNCEPPGLTTAIASVTSSIESAKAATSFEEIQGTMESLPESMEAVNAATEGARALLGIQLPKKSQIERELNERLRGFGLTKGKITSTEKHLGLEAGSLTGKLDGAKAAVLAKVKAVSAAAGACDFEALQGQIEGSDPQEVFDVLDKELAEIAAVVNYADFQKRATDRIKKVEGIIRELRREKVDVTEATAQVAAFKEQIGTVKEVCGAEPPDVDACGEAAAEFEAALENYRDSAQGYLDSLRASKKNVFKGTGLEKFYTPTAVEGTTAQ